jgi:hypothetical protein
MSSHKFYVPVGVVALAAPPVSPSVGDTYFDTVLKSLRSWDGTAWSAGSDEVSIGPSEPLNAAMELWIDSDENPVWSGGLDQATADALYVSISGGALTGPLLLSGAPLVDDEAASKMYVDNAVAPLLVRIAELEARLQ